jgi:MFS superfamily sulfate permease-like transporter
VKYPWTTVLNPEYTLPSLASWETWKIVTGYGSALFATQFIETAVSLNVVNRLDDSDGVGFLVLFGHGISNTLIGFMGGMGASGVVSMSVLADRTFGASSLSTFMTGALLFIFTAWAFPMINYIPLSAISGISIATTCSIIQWKSLFAVFTSFLPNSMRHLLPAEFNIDRLDVSIMLITTTVCLILDVAALFLFLIGVIVSTALVCRERPQKERPQKDQEENQACVSFNNSSWPAQKHCQPVWIQ